jgi:hypothetical protein
MREIEHLSIGIKRDERRALKKVSAGGNTVNKWSRAALNSCF